MSPFLLLLPERKRSDINQDFLSQDLKTALLLSLIGGRGGENWQGRKQTDSCSLNWKLVQSTVKEAAPLLVIRSVSPLKGRPKALSFPFVCFLVLCFCFFSPFSADSGTHKPYLSCLPFKRWQVGEALREPRTDGNLQADLRKGMRSREDSWEDFIHATAANFHSM